MTKPSRHDRPSGISSDRPDQVSDTANTGALYLVLIQVASRALTFAGNQFLLRYLSPAILGLAVQLELVSVTVLYTARESLRVALQRQSRTPDSGSLRARENSIRHNARTSTQQAVNLTYLVLLVGLSVSYIFGHGYLRQSSSEVLQSPDFTLAFSLYALATLIELLSEPAFVVIQHHSLYKARARAETGAAISRCLSACLTAIIMHVRRMPISVLPFAVGQLSYAVTLIFAYLAAAHSVTTVNDFSLIPRKVPGAQTSSASSYWLGLFSKPLLKLTITFYAQSVFKLFLTQGDSVILSLTSDLGSQGAFALASNYGGLLSRLLFQPIEESSRTIFGSLLASIADTQEQSPPATTKAVDGSSSSSSKRDASRYDTAVTSGSVTSSSLPTQQHPKLLSTPSSDSYISPPSESSPSDQGINAESRTSSSSFATAVPITPTFNPDNVTKALAQLTTTLRLYSLFSLPLIALLPHVLPSLIAIITGPHWSSSTTTRLLSAYACYLPFLAINGVLDAFVSCVATPRQLTTQSFVMLGVTLVYGLVAWTLMRGSGNNGIVAAVLPNLELRGSNQASGGMGPAGLVYANMVNMTLRIIYSIAFISKWVSALPPDSNSSPNQVIAHTRWRQVWKASIPHLGCVGTAAVVTVALQTCMYSTAVDATVRPKKFPVLNGLDVVDIGYLAVAALVLGSSILAFELNFLWSVVSKVLPRRIVAKVAPYLPLQKQKAP